MIQRWRVDCRKEDGLWKERLTMDYDTQAEAEAACLRYRTSGEWNTTRVISGLELDLQRVRGVATRLLGTIRAFFEGSLIVRLLVEACFCIALALVLAWICE